MVDPWTLVAAMICGAICMRLATYRRGVSWLAYLLCVGSGCFALSVMLDALHGYRLNPVSPWLTLVLAILLGLVCRARGNLAHILRVY